MTIRKRNKIIREEDSAASSSSDNDDILSSSISSRVQVNSQRSLVIKSISAVGCGVLVIVFVTLLQYWEQSIRPTNLRKAFFASDGISSDIQQYDAVIVGAGWAGISAAKELVEGRVENILVLEAHDYIGGRSKSVNLDGSINNPSMHGNFTNIPIEMGSEWLYKYTELEETLTNSGYLKGIDTIKGSAFAPLRDIPLYLQRFVHEKDENDNIAAMLKTERMENDEAKDLYDRVWKGYLEYSEEYAESLDEDGDVSYGVAARKYKEEKLTSDIDAQFIDLAMAVGELDITGGSNEISIWENAEGQGDPNIRFNLHYMSVPGVGYGNTAAKFAADVAHKIQLSSKVTEIDYSNPNGAIISFTRNGVESKVVAKTVLVTVSLGVLKAGNIKFTPSLPNWKQEVINGMGFGLLNKCVMQWNNPDAAVWPNQDWFELMTPKGENSGKWTTFLNPTSYKGVPTLVGWAAAENARYMETQTDEEILSDVMEKLKAMFPTITPPDRTIITRWGSEENVRGSLSFRIIGREFGEDRRQLQKAVKNVWFAGEATNPYGWYGTTIGARNSGIEAANGILEQLSASSSILSVLSRLFQGYKAAS